MRLTVPAVAPDKANSVVVVESAEEIAADKTRLLLPTVESDLLRVFDAELRGKSLRFGAGKTRDAYVENWSKQNDFVAWPVRLNDPATFEASIVYDADSDSAGGSYILKIGPQTLPGTVKKGQNLRVPLGQVRLEPGTFDIQVVPAKIQGAELMRLRSVILTPSK